MSVLADKIRLLAPDLDRRHVEAWLRLGNDNSNYLDWMADEKFEREVEIAIDALRRRSPEFSEALARARGL